MSLELVQFSVKQVPGVKREIDRANSTRDHKSVIMSADDCARVHVTHAARRLLGEVDRRDEEPATLLAVPELQQPPCRFDAARGAASALPVPGLRLWLDRNGKPARTPTPG